MVALPDDLPDLLPGVDVATPGQRLIADAQVARAGPLGEQAQVVDEDLPVAEGVAGDVAAHQHQVGAQLLHQVELALGAVEVALQTVAAATLEVAKRLEQGDGQAQVGGQLAHFARTGAVVEQVVLEDLHAVEAGGGDRLELFRQGSAERDGGNGTVHESSALEQSAASGCRGHMAGRSDWRRGKSASIIGRDYEAGNTNVPTG